MIPDIQLQLKAAVKSLKDNVLPAIDSDNELAQQQMQLSMATIEIALANLPSLHGVLRKDIEQHAGMAKDMANLLEAGESKQQLTELIEQADSVLANPELGMTQLQLEARAIRSRIGDVITANLDEPALDDIVLQHSEASLALGRALNKPMGFEPSPDDVADVASLLS
ncbi:hypothetical protein IMCC21906_01398 [Spongiibacter sp. IMCC21906]|uniref:hypothetical protein n=1 Tax=Spongiibacter sp. IMCC21906 TaxID=1620392 RepID=UPI00062DDC01|nr:hypothetical protein [Spongiibacter sp. IMCC21906]AKH69076.1 hypothetical protein IMCC21906_01398 [Spongiibacter sp. IMCC21906]